MWVVLVFSAGSVPFSVWSIRALVARNLPRLAGFSVPMARFRMSRWPRRERLESVFSGRVSPEKRRRRGRRLEFSAVSVAIPDGTLLCWARGSVATPQTSVAKRGRLSRNAPRAGRGGPAKAIYLWSRAGACPAAEKGAGGD